MKITADTDIAHWSGMLNGVIADGYRNRKTNNLPPVPIDAMLAGIEAGLTKEECCKLYKEALDSERNR